MKDQFIPYEQALELKELGFDESCFMLYNKHQSLINSDLKNIGLERNSVYNSQSDEIDTITAPLWQQAFDWFRVNYALMGQVTDISIFTGSYKGYRWSYGVFEVDREECIGRDESSLGYLTYSEAKLECLKELIKIVKKINGENKEKGISNR